MHYLAYSRMFWLGLAIGLLVMLPLGLFQAGWLGFFIHPSVWSEISLADGSIWFALLVALLSGANLGGLLYITRCTGLDDAGEPGFFGFLGAIVAWFALYCVACQATLLTLFGVAILATSVAPYVPYLKAASVILLLISFIMVLRRVKNPHACKVR